MSVATTLPTNILNSLVSIDRFNRGKASEVFKEVREEGVKFVLKNNNPVCVLLDVEKYNEMMEMIVDCYLLLEAEKRTNTAGDMETVSWNEIMTEFNITQEELDSVDVEIE